MKTFVCTFPEGSSIPNVVGIHMSLRDRIKHLIQGIHDAYIDEDFTSGPDRIIQVRCTSPEAALFVKLAFANHPVVHVAELRPMARTETWSQLT
jgi:hypothetical protein